MAIEIDRADTVQLVHDIAAATGLDVEEVVYQAVRTFGPLGWS